jgi:hypothetical protein
VKIIQLAFCRIEWRDWGCETIFNDGARIGAHPHPADHHYHVVSHRCGYSDDLMRYRVEHEVCHSFLAERILPFVGCDGGQASHVLWNLAHGRKPWPGFAVSEEALVQTFQAWLRANQEPIIGDVDWRGLKAEALGLLEAWKD